MLENTIDRRSIAELLDGSYFYIPSYQRGYRWTEEQVVDLLRDLFSFANEKNKDDFGYYCLQPVVVRRITDKNVIERIFGSQQVHDDKNVWEVVDGQQRLTTIYILLRYLLKRLRYADDKEFSDDYGKDLYHIIYASRKDSSEFLKNLDQCETSQKNIDFYHMKKAYDTIGKWISNTDEYQNTGSAKICSHYHVAENVKSICETFLKLLTTSKDTISPTGSAQVLWYELSQSTNAVKEFRKINTGKIYLTDAELLKALFLRHNNFFKDKEKQHLEKAMEWENIENTLHNNSFWYFLNPVKNDMPNRIDFIFRILYKSDLINGKPKEEWDDILIQCDDNLSKKNLIFNYFYDKFDGLAESALNERIDEEWKNIKSTFHIFEDWYEDAECYNLIGLLSQFGGNLITKCYCRFISMTSSESRDDFKKYLKSLVKEKMSHITASNNHIDLDYKRNRTDIYNLLLLLNINHLNKQVERTKAKEDIGAIYKFPFALLSTKDWDIEHIDSFTANQLIDIKTQDEWIQTAKDDVQFTKEQLQEIDRLSNGNKKKDAIDYIRNIVEDEEADDDIKNRICNLTLLDAGTNRSYGNALFLSKRKRIIENMKNGIYVPITTTYVFAKLFDEFGTNRSKWTLNDMNMYETYMFNELKDFLNVKN